MHSSSEVTATRKGMEDQLKEPQQINLRTKGHNKQAKTGTRVSINPTLLQSLAHTVLRMRGMEKHDRYLHTTAIYLAHFGCLRAGELSYQSTHCYHTVQLWLKQSKRDQARKGATIIIGPSLVPRLHPQSGEKGLGTSERILGFAPSACSVFW